MLKILIKKEANMKNGLMKKKYQGILLAGAAALLLITGFLTAAEADKQVESTAKNPAIEQPGPTQVELDAAAGQGINWLHATHDYTGQRFVDLSEITAKNVGNLHPVAIFQTSEYGPSQTNPLVYNGVMYITTTHLTVALDAATGRKRWEYTWKAKDKEVFITNRGAAIKDGLVVRGTADGFLIALDAATGALKWERQVASPKNGEFLSAPPLIANDRIIIGPAGSEWASKGWVGAFKLSDGTPIWKFNTVPDPGEPGAKTWGKDPAVLAHGGGSVWTPLSFDRARDLVHVAIGNPAPDLYDNLRPGDNLYTCSMIALDVNTGKLRWHFQAVPHDTHDWDITQVSPLFTTRVKGIQRDLIAVAGKDGLLRVLDRQSHALLYSVPFTKRENVDVPISTDPVHVFPGGLGGEEWSGPAYNRITDMLYVPSVENGCTYVKAKEAPDPKGEGLFLGGTFTMDPWEQSHGSLTAFDAATGKQRWIYLSGAPMLAGVCTTSGGLVFTGEHGQDFLALDASTGEVLYRFNTGGPVAGGVVSYSVNGKQYVAAICGFVSPFFAPIGGGTTTVIIFAL
jgi:alcohol dehydrogenase (cytochrome c)